MNVLCNPTDSPRRCVLIAEIGANHCRNYDRAAAMIRASRWAGADAVKVQLFEAADLTLNSDDLRFKITDGPWAGQTLWQLYEKAAMPLEWTPKLKELAESLGLKFVASVYHPRMVPLAEDLGIDYYKISSFEIGWTDLLKAVSATGKPTFISTGTANYDEIDHAVALFGASEMALLKCVSQYPAKLEDMNLATIPDMAREFRVPVGLSDHSTGIVAPVVAVALGAQIVEKHLMLALDEDTLDAAFSVTPQQFRTMVETVRAAEAAIGEVSYEPTSLKYKRREVNGVWVRTVT